MRNSPAIAVAAALALCGAGGVLARPDASGGVAVQPPDHIGCMAIYALVAMGIPQHAELAAERAAHAHRMHRDELPASATWPAPMTGSALDEELRQRIQARGARIVNVETEEDVIRETDALMADAHACDAIYGFAPTPVPLWQD